jgi:hypothetical protein
MINKDQSQKAWAKKWPNHCRHCGGWGFTVQNSEKTDCPKKPDRCHRCGHEEQDCGVFHPCDRCGWEFDDGI